MFIELICEIDMEKKNSTSNHISVRMALLDKGQFLSEFRSRSIILNIINKA